MKKLLSLLSVLTISGTSVPTTIAASPYPNQENLNREKRQPEQTNWAISLNVPNIIQVGSIYCGPAVAESVLRSLGLNVETFLNNVNVGRSNNNRYLNIQHYIASILGINVEGSSGTLPYRLNDIINEILRSQNLNRLSYQTEWFRSPRYFGMRAPAPFHEISPAPAPGYTQLETALDFQYGLIERLNNPPRWQNLLMEIERNFREDFVRNLNLLVRSSLQNNTPVIFAQSFQPSARVYGHIGRHFVLIDSIGPDNDNNQEQIIYRIMDPATGIYSNVNALDLYYRGGDVFALTFFNSVRLELQNQIPIEFPNVDEPIEIGSYNNVVNQLILPIISNPVLFALVFLNFERNIDCTRQRRETTNINYWHKKFCDLKPQIEKIKGKLTVVKILQKNKGDQGLSPGNLKVGDIYVGTTERVYLIRDIFGSTRVEEFDDLLNFSIKNIVIDEKGNAYALSNNNIYYLRYTPGLGWSASSILIGNSKKNIINMKEILKNSNDNYLKAGDIYVQTDNGNYLIHNNQQTEKITTDKNYFINHSDNNITTLHFNREDNSYCHNSTGKKIAAVSTATAIGASAGSVIPGLGTLIGAGLGALVGVVLDRYL